MTLKFVAGELEVSRDAVRSGGHWIGNSDHGQGFWRHFGFCTFAVGLLPWNSGTRPDPAGSPEAAAVG